MVSMPLLTVCSVVGPVAHHESRVAGAVRIPLLRRHVVIGSIVYGLGVFVVMNMIVLPLSAAPRLPPPEPSLFIEMIVEHALVVGLPLGLLVRRDAMRR